MRFGSRYTIRFALAAVLAALPGRASWAQGGAAGDTAPKPAIAAPAPPDAAPYRLGPDDVVTITVINFPNLSSQIVVPPDGLISVPLLDPQLVTGKTTGEVAQMLAEKWRRYVVHPSVTVSLYTRRKQENILCYGYVLRPGTVEYRPTLRLMQALAEVGGAQQTGDLSQVTLTRASGGKRIFNLSKPETRGGTEVDVQLEPGDVLFVPERTTQVTVLGEVNRPGSFDYRDEMTVLDALTQAGGIRGDSADLLAATLIHNGREQRLDLESLLRRGDIAVNIRLSAGDRLMVPEIRNRTYVFGAVSRPGFYLFKEGDRVLDALNGTGGPMRDADLRRLNIVRIDRGKNTANVEVVDIERFLKRGDLRANVPLAPGDVVFVPDRKRGFQWQDLLGVLSGLNLLSNTARLVR